MTHPRNMERDDRFLQWLVRQPEWLNCGCLICGAQAERCHLVAKGMGGGKGSDYWVFPACHDHHMMRDHSPRWGRLTTVTRIDWDASLAIWWDMMYVLRSRYVSELMEAGRDVPEPLTYLQKVFYIRRDSMPKEVVDDLRKVLGEPVTDLRVEHGPDETPPW